MSETTKTRRIPVRRCTGCSGHFPKNELIRVVRTPTGEIMLDPGGRAAGRGAYLCQNAGCLRKARKARRLDSAFGCTVDDTVYDRLEGELSHGD